MVVGCNAWDERHCRAHRDRDRYDTSDHCEERCRAPHPEWAFGHSNQCGVTTLTKSSSKNEVGWDKNSGMKTKQQRTK